MKAISSFLSLIILGGSFSSLSAADPLPLSSHYWKDDAFLKAFNGSYRINARVEPNVTGEERALLVSIEKNMADGQRQAAIDKLKASPLAGNSAAIQFNLGNLYFEEGENELALESFQSALKKLPTFRRAHRNISYVYARELKWDDALPHLVQALELGDQSGSVYGLIGYCRMEKEQYASALQAYRMAQITEPDSLDWKAGVAQCLQFLNQNEEALALIEEVIQSRPDEDSYYLLQASIQLAMGRPADARVNLELLRRYEKLDAENQLLLANLHLQLGQLELARPVLQNALKQEKLPALATALNSLEYVVSLREWQLASEFLVAVKSTWPESEDIQLDRRQRRLSAIISIDSESAPADGVRVLEQLIAEDPLDGEALVLLAKFRISEQRTEEAAMLFEQAAKVAEVEREAKLEHGKMLVALRRYVDAIPLLESALNLQPEESLATYLSAVKSLAEAKQ